MAHRQSSIEEDTGLDMTPMIDCVFLLLIFFMVTTVFQQPHSLKVDLPEARRSAVVEEKKLVATITADGRMEVNRHPVALGDLPSLLAQEQHNTRSLTLIVRTDRETRHGLLLEVLEMAKRLGIEQVVLATDDPKGAPVR